MDSAKNAVKGFMSKSGHHDTSVHETTAPAVTNETINQHRHENVTTAIDKEVHQDHYHTTVQPVQDTNVLPEQHHHNMGAVQERKFEHGNDADVKRRLEAERAQFKDTTVKGDTKHTSSVNPTLAGEHIHHHVHENIQPVIDRQTIQPHVVHTTVPIHETHHSAAQHHSTSTLPAVNMADFKKQGGSISGSEQRSDFFEGEPKSMHGHAPHTGDASSQFRKTGHVDQHGHDSSRGAGAAGLGAGAAAGAGAAGLASHRRRGSNSSSSSSDSDSGRKRSHRTKAAGLTGAGAGSGLTGNHNTTGSGLTGNHNTTGSGLTGNHDTTGNGLTGNHNTTGTGSGLTGNHATTGTGHGVNDTTTTKKPSLLDRLNPMKDTDGDGKKGMMD